jgi:TonB family protein
VIIAVVLTVIAVAIAFYYFQRREKMMKPPAPTQQDVGALMLSQPNEVPEQSFVISQTEGRGTVLSQATLETAPAQAGASASGESFAPRRSGRSEQSSKKGRSGRRPLPEQLSVPESPPLSSPREPGREATSQEVADNQGETIVDEARIVHLARPQLPGGVYASGLEGQVVVQVEIDRDGRPRQVRILRSTNDLLDGPIIDAINNSEFVPRKMSSGPVASRLTIPFSFRARR